MYVVVLCVFFVLLTIYIVLSISVFVRSFIVVYVCFVSIWRAREEASPAREGPFMLCQYVLHTRCLLVISFYVWFALQSYPPLS